MSILIRGGRLVTAADDFVADVLIEGERVTLVGADLDVSADRTIDAAGKYVLPGCIDPHTHLDMPFGGTVTIDDFESGHGSAACGGTTCHVDFCIQGRGQTFAEALEGWHAKANGKALIDYGFHIAVTDLDDGGTLEELASLPEQGVTSYKLFMAYKGVLQVDDETLFRAMQVAAGSGALVMVHAENGDAIDVLVHEALARGGTEPIHHALTRPPELEGEATNRAIQLARIAGSPLYVVHVTCREAVDPIRRARASRAGTSGARRARNTSSGRSTTSRSRTSRAPSTCTRRPRAMRRITTCSGTRCGPTRSRRSRPTTARSCGTGRRRWGGTTSRRSRTAGRGSRTG
jgi:dihydropyrimidinase